MESKPRWLIFGGGSTLSFMVQIYMAYTSSWGIRFCKALSEKQARKIIEDKIHRDAVNEIRSGKTSIHCKEVITSIELYKPSEN